MFKKLTEIEIAEVIEYFFTCKGWNLYPEVVTPLFSGRPDFISVKNSIVASIEVKKSFSYPVIEQLVKWFEVAEERAQSSNHANLAMPHLLICATQITEKNNSITWLKKKLLSEYGLGFYGVIYKGKGYDRKERTETPPKVRCTYFDGRESYSFLFKGYAWEVVQLQIPKIQALGRRTAHKIMSHLHEDMKTGIAGATGAEGAYMTEFKRTMNKATSVLERGGEWHIKTLIDTINNELGGHHYISDQNARASIGKFLKEKNIAQTTERGLYFLTEK